MTAQVVTGIGSLVIRRAEASDEVAVRALLASAGLPTDGVRDQFGPSYALATRAGAVVGVAGVEVYGSWGLLRSVAVTPDAQGTGVGEALVRDRIGWAGGRGLAGMVLLTTTVPDFFTRFGFERIDRSAAPSKLMDSSEFASICPETAVVMRLVLGEPQASVDAGERVRAAVRANYGRAALRVVSPTAGEDSGACCGPSCCGGSESDPITRDLYDALEVEDVPEQAVLASLGCGNPTALAELRPGETVLDLGSGGGIDVLLSAKRVGPSGRAIGLDMTDEMLALARKNSESAGADNVEFLKGEIEHIPLPDQSVDVIISNCVINLSADKDRVLAEAFRVLKPGGRFAVSDVVTRGEIPAAIRDDLEAWTGCIAGALDEHDYREKLERTGFSNVDVELWRVYDMYDGKFASAFVRATKT
jgi:N-acetylglutamate synthase-like GNAT family acetyltransferase/SAM-dependent methyltransferase